MRFFACFFSSLCCFFILAPISLFSAKLDTIFSSLVKKNNYCFEKSIKEYKESESWRIWSIPFHKYCLLGPSFSSDTSFSSSPNLFDFDLNSFSVFRKRASNDYPKLKVELRFQDVSFFGSAYQFYGRINLFNGNLRSLKKWRDFSRIKIFKIYFNENPLCYVKLEDSWHYQFFSIADYFKNPGKKESDGIYEVNSGDFLVFEIIETYKGEEKSRVAISEFLKEGAKN